MSVPNMDSLYIFSVDDRLMNMDLADLKEWTERKATHRNPPKYITSQSCVVILIFNFLEELYGSI